MQNYKYNNEILFFAYMNCWIFTLMKNKLQLRSSLSLPLLISKKVFKMFNVYVIWKFKILISENYIEFCDIIYNDVLPKKILKTPHTNA